MAIMYAIKNFLISCMFSIVSLIRWVKHYFGWTKVTDHQYGIYEFKNMRASDCFIPRAKMEALQTFEAFRPDDVVVLTYPKAGTHFLGDVIQSIYLEKGLIPKLRDHLTGMTPLELGPPIPIDSLGYNDPLHIMQAAASPRIMGTHLPWSLLPPPYQERGGQVVYGGFFEFLKDWYPHRNEKNNFYIYYEDLIKDLAGSARRIAKFLDLDLSDEQVGRIVEQNTFANLKKKVGNTFIHRQGTSGSWKREFSVEQNARADEWIENGMKGLEDLKFDYN